MTFIPFLSKIFKMKKKYELVLLFGDAAKAEDQEKATEKIKKDLAEADGKLLELKDLGKKELAYLIKKNGRATFKHLLIELPTETLSAFRRKLTLNESILRFLLVVKD